MNQLRALIWSLRNRTSVNHHLSTAWATTTKSVRWLTCRFCCTISTQRLSSKFLVVKYCGDLTNFFEGIRFRHC